MKSKQEDMHPFYVGFEFSEYHFKKLRPNEGPSLHTERITDCTGIGFIYKEEGQVQTIGLYHSVSEHAPNQNEIKRTLNCIKENSGDEPKINDYCKRNATNGAQFIRSIHDMLSNTNNGKLTVIVHDSRHSTGETGNKANLENVKQVVDAVQKEMGKKLAVEFVNHRGEGAFYVTTKGEYSTSTPDEKETLAIRLAQYINDKLYNYFKDKHAAGYLHSITFLNKDTLKCNGAAKQIMELINDGFRHPERCSERLKDVLAILEKTTQKKDPLRSLYYGNAEMNNIKELYLDLKKALDILPVTESYRAEPNSLS